MELLLQATRSKDDAHRLEPTRRYRDRLCCCKCSAKLLNPVAPEGRGRPRLARAGEGVRAYRAILSPLHVWTADSVHAGRCVEAGGHRPRRGWAGPIDPLG